MIAVDTNILRDARRRDSPWRNAAKPLIEDLAASGARWAIAWTCGHEFIGVATHPRGCKPSSTLAEAFAQSTAWRGSPTLELIGETSFHLPALAPLSADARILGPAIHDARIAALRAQHGVRDLWSADRDFSRSLKVRVRNPLIGAGAARQ